METPFYRLFTALAAVLVLTVSCSTTRVLSEGEYMLSKNSIEVTNSKKFDPSSLNQYIKQQPNSTLFGWNPLMSVYNWAAPDNESGMARFLRKIGTEPVVYSPNAVESTIDNIESHLEYIGYYNSKVISNIRVYVQGTNLFCATKYSGLDPEVDTRSSKNPLTPGVDFSAYPKSRGINVGMNIQF